MKQGSAADIAKKAMLKVFHAWSGFKNTKVLVLQMHDELIAEVNKSCAEMAKKELMRCMEEAGRDCGVDKVDLPVSVREGYSWEDLTSSAC